MDCYDINEIIELNKYNKSRPYLFRTRLERVLNRIIRQSEKKQDQYVHDFAVDMKEKLRCLSDQSNQSTDGTLKSYDFLKNDIYELYSMIHN